MSNRAAYIVALVAMLCVALIGYMMYVAPKRIIPIGIAHPLARLFLGTPLTKAQLEAQKHFSQPEIKDQAHVVSDAMSPDPGGDQYRGEDWHGEVFCGEVNLKNHYGGYNGWTPFSMNAVNARRATATGKAEYGKFAMGWGQIDPACGPMQP